METNLARSLGAERSRTLKYGGRVGGETPLPVAMEVPNEDGDEDNGGGNVLPLGKRREQPKQRESAGDRADIKKEKKATPLPAGIDTTKSREEYIGLYEDKLEVYTNRLIFLQDRLINQDFDLHGTSEEMVTKEMRELFDKKIPDTKQTIRLLNSDSSIIELFNKRKLNTLSDKENDEIAAGLKEVAKPTLDTLLDQRRAKQARFDRLMRISRTWDWESYDDPKLKEAYRKANDEELPGVIKMIQEEIEAEMDSLDNSKTGALAVLDKKIADARAAQKTKVGQVVPLRPRASETAQPVNKPSGLFGRLRSGVKTMASKAFGWFRRK